MKQINVEKFIASILRRKSGFFNGVTNSDILAALKEQGFEYEDGSIVEQVEDANNQFLIEGKWYVCIREDAERFGLTRGKLYKGVKVDGINEITVRNDNGTPLSINGFINDFRPATDKEITSLLSEKTLDNSIDLYYYTYGNGKGEFEHLSLEKFRDIVHTFVEEYGKK